MPDEDRDLIYWIKQWWTGAETVGKWIGAETDNDLFVPTVRLNPDQVTDLRTRRGSTIQMQNRQRIRRQKFRPEMTKFDTPQPAVDPYGDEAGQPPPRSPRPISMPIKRATPQPRRK